MCMSPPKRRNRQRAKRVCRRFRAGTDVTLQDECIQILKNVTEFLPNWGKRERISENHPAGRETRRLIKRFRYTQVERGWHGILRNVENRTGLDGEMRRW